MLIFLVGETAKHHHDVADQVTGDRRGICRQRQVSANFIACPRDGTWGKQAVVLGTLFAELNQSLKESKW